MSMMPDGLEHAARALREGGDSLERLASSAPDAPDAGPCTDGVAAVLAWFADSASRLVGGAHTSADSVTESVREYERADAGTAEALRALGGGGRP
jgi:hypothetical protein